MARHRRRRRRYPDRPPAGLAVLTTVYLLMGLPCCGLGPMIGSGPNRLGAAIPGAVMVATGVCLLVRRPWGWWLAAGAHLLGGVVAGYVVVTALWFILQGLNQFTISLLIVVFGPAVLTAALFLTGFFYLVLPHVRAAFGL
jgi:hypothetical protein